MPKLCVIPGDGIGKEVVPHAVQMLRRVIPDLETVEAEAGWESFQKYGTSVPEETLRLLKDCGAGIFGAVSSPSHYVKGYRSAILVMRQELDLFANIRPVRSLPGLCSRQDVDLIIVRENTEGLYAGRETRQGDTAIAERVITARASKRIAQRVLTLACQNWRKKITIVHKANILPVTDGLFRDCIYEIAADFFPGGCPLDIDEMLVDTAAYNLVAAPERFDVIVTTNLFGDILSDVAAFWCGGMGLAPALNLGEQVALAEPVHGSAPDIARKGIANPIAAILSASLLARLHWGLTEAAERIDSAVWAALDGDLQVQNYRLSESYSTQEIAEAVMRNL